MKLSTEKNSKDHTNYQATLILVHVKIFMLHNNVFLLPFITDMYDLKLTSTITKIVLFK